MAIKGGDTSALRIYNERLILSSIRRYGPQSKAELGRLTSLSSQAASDIAKRLLADGLIIEKAKIRTGVGQPKTPLALNPDGAFSIGVKIGRSSLEAVLLDLTGDVRARLSKSYSYPKAETTIAHAISMTKELLAGMNDDAQRRVVGIGLAMPSAIYQWDTEMGLPEGALSDWKDRDPAAEISEATNHPCLLINDANAACAAELEHPENQLTETGIYLYFATFIGGAVVIDGRLFTGFRDQAGAIGSMPVPGTNGAGIAPQLIERASLLPLLQNLEAAGIDRAFFSQLQEDAIPSAAIPLFETWCADAAPHLAHSIFASASLLDIDKVVLDGILPPAWLDQLSQAVQTALAKFNTKGVAEFDISTGHLGRSARVMGAALMPFDARFTPDPSHLVTRSKLQPKAAAPA